MIFKFTAQQFYSNVKKLVLPIDYCVIISSFCFTYNDENYDFYEVNTAYIFVFVLKHFGPALRIKKNSRIEMKACLLDIHKF